MANLTFHLRPSHRRYKLSAYTLRLCEGLESAGRVRTARAYRTTLRRLLGFIGGKDIPLKDVTPLLVESFERRLKEEGLSPNTISFYMRNLRSIYHRAVEDGLVEKGVRNPFKNVFTGFYKTTKRALSTPQMQQVQQMRYSRWLEQGYSPVYPEDSVLYTCWRLFIFCFHARGMSFTDMAYLRKDNISGGVIRYYRKKTGKLIEVKVTPLLHSLIESFARETTGSPYVFPVICGIGKDARLQYESALSLQNRRLKQLAQEAGIEVPLSTHVSRHSWASIAKSSDTPLWVISEGLGHSSEKVTYTYLASLERSRLDMANEAVCALVCRQGFPRVDIKARL